MQTLLPCIALSPELTWDEVDNCVSIAAADCWLGPDWPSCVSFSVYAFELCHKWSLLVA